MNVESGNDRWNRELTAEQKELLGLPLVELDGPANIVVRGKIFLGTAPAPAYAMRKANEIRKDEEAGRAFRRLRDAQEANRPAMLAIVPIPENEHHYWVRINVGDGSLDFKHIGLYGLTNARFGDLMRPRNAETDTWFPLHSDPTTSWATAYDHHNTTERSGACICRAEGCTIIGYSFLAPEDRVLGNRLYEGKLADAATRWEWFKKVRARDEKRAWNRAETKRKREERKAQTAANAKARDEMESLALIAHLTKP